MAILRDFRDDLYITKDPNSALHRWITIDALLSWIRGMIYSSRHDGGGRLPHEIESLGTLYHHLMRCANGAEGSDVFLGEYLYYIQHSIVEKTYRIYRAERSKINLPAVHAGFTFGSVEEFINIAWLSPQDEVIKRDGFWSSMITIDEVHPKEEELECESKVKPDVDSSEYDRVVFGI